VSGSLSTPRSKAADLLLRAQVLTRPLYERVLDLLDGTTARAEEILLDNDMISETDLLRTLSGIYQTQFVSTEKLARADIPRATVQMIPRRVAETLGVFPVLFDPQQSVLSIVTPDPDNGDLLREVKLVSGARNVKAFVVRPAAIAAAIRKHHGGDTRAFEAFSRPSMAIDFGQQVTSDGRVIGSRESVKLRALEETPGAGAMTPSRVPRAIPIDDFGTGTGGQSLAPARPQKPPPPVPQRPPPNAPAVTGRREIASLSLPPPPMGTLEPPPAPPPPAPSNATADEDWSSLGSPAAPANPSAMPGPKPARSAGQSTNANHPDHAEPARADSASSTASAAPGGTHPPNSDVAREKVLTHDTTVELLTVMVSLLENTRQELRGHSSQVSRLLRRVAERMNLDRAETYAVIVAGHIHDIGKMGQFHLTALNCSEYDGHKVAAQKGYDTPLRLLEAVRLPASIRNAVFHMYERFDGKGFPDKLAGKEIPLGARLLSAADTYADLTQNPRNPFRKVLSPAEAMNVLAEHRGTIFDPGLIDLFKAIVLGEDMKAKLLANRYRCLVVDPDPEESTVLELRLVEQGFDVRTARSAEAARKLLSSGDDEFDLVVSEVELPDTDGLAFLSEARKEKWGRDLPWVVHTHKQSRTEAQRAFELGAMDFVAKPVQADVLVAKLKAMLDQWSNQSKSSKGVSGSLREMGLPDIVQVLFHGRKTGRLNVRSNGKSGEIHFLEGAIANALFGEHTGASAFYQMLKFTEGDFALDPGFTPAARLVEESSEALLLEGMRRMDEGI
jgi:response regulator RpfG family c-di-GMP phosphodiesterase